MTNSEFIDLLVVTGKLDLRKIGKDEVALEYIGKIREYPKYIGGIYFKLLDLNNIKLAEVLRIMIIIMIGFDLNYEEMDIIIKRFEYIHDKMDKGYTNQIINMYVQLKDYAELKNKGLDRKEVLYDCKLIPPSNGIDFFNKRGRTIYKVKFEEKINVEDMLHRKIICKDLKYIILSEKGLEFIEEGKEDLERDKYKYRVNYRKGRRNGEDK